MKTCSQCKEAKPRTEYYRRPRSKDGLCSECKECCKKRSLAHYYAHLAEHRALRNLYAHAHREELAAKARKHREAHPGYMAEYHRKNKEREFARLMVWRKEHPDAVKAIARRYRQKHPKTASARHTRYARDYALHGKEIQDRRRQYRKDHPEYLPHVKALRRARKAGILSVPEAKAIMEIYRRAKMEPKMTCYLCEQLIPKGKRRVDHVVPLAAGGPHSPENLAIVCATCNGRKYTKLPNQVGLLL